jgi:hypothetical protein
MKSNFYVNTFDAAGECRGSRGFNDLASAKEYMDRIDADLGKGQFTRLYSADHKTVREAQGSKTMKTMKFDLYLVCWLGEYSKEVLYDIWTREPSKESDVTLLQTFSVEREVDTSNATLQVIDTLRNVKRRHLAEGQAKAAAVEDAIQSLLALPNGSEGEAA